MTKGEIVGQVLLRISGGRPNTDISTRYNEVAGLIAPCVNYLYTKQYYIEKREEDGSKDVNPLMLQTFTEVPVLDDSVREKKYSELPATPITLPSGRSVDFVGTNAGKGFIPISQQDADLEEYYACFKSKAGVHSYMLEGKRVYYYNEPDPFVSAMIKMIVNVNELDDDDEVALPSGTEPELLNMIYDLITGVRRIPEDKLIDGHEDEKRF